MPVGPTKSMIAREIEDRGIHDFRPKSRTDSIETYNPLMGFSESEPK